MMISGRSYGRDREDDYSVRLCPKKPKHNNVGRRKVPRRGPGVAELEKIRLEEQHISSVTPRPPPPPPPPRPEKRSLPPILPTTTNRTGPVYPFSSYFASGNFPVDMIPPAPVFQKKHDSSLHYLPPMNLPNPGSGGFYQFIEPPSNQTSCIDNVYNFIDKEKAKFLSSRSHIQDSGTTCTIPILANSSLDFPRFIQKEEFDHETMSRRSGIDHSSKRKPFYSFLPSNEKSIRNQEPSFNMKTKRHESYDTTNDHNIDLRLKL